MKHLGVWGFVYVFFLYIIYSGYCFISRIEREADLGFS